MRAALLLLVACGAPPAVEAPCGHLATPSWASPAKPAVATTIAPAATVVVIAEPEVARFTGGKKIDLDIVGADVRDVCRLVAELVGANIVVEDGVSGAVTVRLVRVPWRDALTAILVAKGLHLEQVGTILIVRR